MYLLLITLWLAAPTSQSCLNGKRLYKRIETEYNKPNPWYYFQSDESGKFDVNARKPFLLSFWFKANFSELFEVIPVAFPCMNVANNITMRLNSSKMLEIGGQEFFSWENNKWGFILLSVHLALKKKTLVTSLLDSDGTLMTSYASETTSLENCYISFFASNLTKFTEFNGVMEDISIYDKLISKKELKLLLQEQEPRLRFYLDFSVSNGLVLPNLSHYLMKHKFSNYTLDTAEDFFLDSTFGTYTAVNGGSNDHDVSNMIPNAQDWILNQQKKFVELPTEILKDASSFSVYMSFDVVAKLKNYRFNKQLDTDEIDNLTLYSRINAEDPRQGLDLKGGLSKSFNSEWQMPMTLGLYDRTDAVLDIDYYFDFVLDTVVLKNHFILVKVWNNRFTSNYNVSLRNIATSTTASAILSFTEYDQHYIGSIFNDSEGFAQIFYFKLNEFAFFENTLTVTNLICTENSDSIRLGLGNSLEIGCKDTLGNIKLLKECAAGSNIPSYCSIPNCEICSLDGSFCIERKNGMVPVNEDYQSVWNFDHLVYDKVTKNVIPAIGNFNMSNKSYFELNLDFPAKYSVLLVINMQIMVSRKDEDVDIGIYIEDEQITSVNCKQSLNCKNQTIDVYITIQKKITANRKLILEIYLPHGEVEYYVKSLKYGLNRIYDKCGNGLVTDYKLKCTICSVPSGAQYKYLPLTGNYLYGECVESCPTGYYELNNVCQKCPEKCPKCTSASSCNNCYNELTYEPVVYDYGNSIDTSTFANFQNIGSTKINYIASFYKKCVPCFDFCDNCSITPANCSTCASGYYLDISGNCRKCNSECLECSAGLRTHCTKCAAGKYVSTTSSCDSCSTNCATCETTHDNCITCNNQVAIMDESGKCIGKEYTNMFLHSVLNLYQKCEDCTSCVQNTQVVCGRCPICNTQCGVTADFIQSKVKIFEIDFQTIKTFSNSNITSNLFITDATTDKVIEYSIWEIAAPNLFVRINDNSFATDETTNWKVNINMQPELIEEAVSCYISPIQYTYQIVVNRNDKVLIILAQVIFTITFVVGIIFSFKNIQFLAFVVSIHHSIFALNFLLSLRSSDNSLLFQLLQAMLIDFRAFDVKFLGLDVEQGLVDKYKFSSFNTIDIQEKFTVGFNLFHVLELIIGATWIVTWLRLNVARYNVVRNAFEPVELEDKKSKLRKVHEITEILFINVFMFFMPYQYLDYANVTIRIISDLGFTYYSLVCTIGLLIYNYILVIILIRFGNILRRDLTKKRPTFFATAFNIFPIETTPTIGLHSICFFVSMVRHILIIFVQITFKFSDFVSGFIVSFLNLFYFALIMNSFVPHKIYYLQFVNEFVLFFMTYMLIFNDLIAGQINWKDIIYWFFSIYSIFTLIYTWSFYGLFMYNFVKEIKERKRISPSK